MVKRISLLTMTFIIVFIFLSNVFAGTIQLPRTGQTKCYDTAGTEIACAGTGQDDGDIQAGVAWPDPRFADNLDGTVTDNLTGLAWTQDAGTPTAGACSGEGKTWQGALDYVACLNSNNYLGHNDWRLPNADELESLINADQSDSATWLNTQGFSRVRSSYTSYWSSTTHTYATNEAFVVKMVGYVHSDKKNSGAFVWPVRSGQFGSPDPSYPANIWKTGQKNCYDTAGTGISCAGTGQDGEIRAGVAWPDPRFADNGNWKVTDRLTGLMWTKDANTPGPYACNPGTGKTWQEASDFIKCLNNYNYLGHTDWRLPNRKEIYSLIDYSKLNPALPSGYPFIRLDTGSNVCSTTTIPWSASGVFMVRIWDGFLSGGCNKNYACRWWPVRSGQSGIFGNLSISPVDYDFGSVNVGTSSAPQTFTISNTSTSTLHFSGISLSDTTNYQLDVNGGINQCGSTTPTINPDGSCTVTVTFNPTSTGQKDATLSINSDYPDTPIVNVLLTGNGVVPSTELAILVPNGGDVMPSGGTYVICWEAPLNLVKFDLKYTTGGGIWTAIKTVTGLNCTHWEIPVLIANKNTCLVKVIGYDSDGVPIGEDISDKPFTIEVVRVTSPNGRETLTSGSAWTIRWVSHETIRPVAKTVLKYTINGGTTWKAIKTLTGNLGSYNWTVPSVLSTKNRCKVKVILKDASGMTVGIDVSDKVFTIQP